MDRFTMYPMAFITTIQPYLFAWVMAISFFITLAVVALLSRRKTWKQTAALSVGCFVVISVIVALCTSMLLDIHVMEVEMVWVSPRGS
jgi:hypothetical protein